MLKKRNDHFFSFGFLLIMMGSLSACNKIEAPSSDTATTSTTTTTLTSYTCPTFSSNTKYDSLLACQLATNANCTSSSEKFPNGSNATCYTPVAGWESCTTTPTWQYTVYTLQSITTGGYRLKRSLLGCSSSVCLCSGTPSLVKDITYGAYVPYVSGLPATCNTTTCDPYVYQGGLTIEGITFNLTTAPGVVGTPPMSTDTAPTITIPSGGPNGFTMKIYGDANCSTTSLGSAVIAGGTGTTGGLAVSGGGLKRFYATLSNGTTGTSCADTGVSFYQLVSPPALSKPATVIVPSLLNPSGSSITLNFGYSDNAGMSYTCKYDNVVDGTAIAGADCSTLTGAVFSPTTGEITGTLTWAPSGTLNGIYEFCVTGINVFAAANTQCAAVYLMNTTSYTLTVTPAPAGSPSMSLGNTPTIGITGGAGAAGFNYKLYSDSSCSNLLGSTALNGAGNGSITVSLTAGGTKTFYGQFQDPVSLAYSSCINTTKSYYLVAAPVLNQPNSLTFPSNEVKAGTPIILDFHASDATGVTYVCKYDQVVDNTAATGALCSTLPGATSNASFSSTGVLSWTPPQTAYGPYEFCVLGTQSSTPNPTDFKCAVVDVIPNPLILTTLSHYYDAQFATSAGGQNINPVTTWKDLIGSADGTLTGTAGTTASGWTTTSPYSVKLNTGAGTVPTGIANYPYPSGFHKDYVDLSTMTNSNQSFSADMWINARGAPLITLNTYFWPAIGFPQCNGAAGCVPGSNNDYPFSTITGYIMDFFETANDRGLKVRVKDNGAGTAYQLEAEINKSDGSYSSTSSDTFSYNSWYHVVVIWDQFSSNASLYANGKVELIFKPAGNTNYLPILSRQMILGSDKNGSYRFNGEIANFRTYDSASSAVPSVNCSAERSRFGVVSIPNYCP